MRSLINWIRSVMLVLLHSILSDVRQLRTMPLWSRVSIVMVSVIAALLGVLLAPDVVGVPGLGIASLFLGMVVTVVYAIFWLVDLLDDMNLSLN